jgi:primosomal protein N' (replication factor Y)
VPAPARDELRAGAQRARRYVELAVDAVGVAGDRTYTYHLPDGLADLAPGEAVLVDYGRRRALAIVLGEGDPPPEVETRPVLERVRSDGPLLPPLQLALARHISEHYLAPPAMVIRAMLPPGLLERLALVARAEDGVPESAAAKPSGDELLDRVRAAGNEGISVTELARGADREAVVRQLRALQAQGSLTLDWELLPSSATPRLERRVALTDRGREVAAGTEAPGRPLGPRQQALLAELLAGDGSDQAAALLTRRHGASALSGLARRGLVELSTAVVERRPLEGREPSGRGAKPAEADLAPGQARAVELVRTAIQGRERERFLLRGVAAAGKTAVYSAMVAEALAAGRGALVLVPEIALAVPLLDRLEAELGIRAAVLHSALGDGERADEWRRIRRGETGLVVGTRLAVLAPLADPGVIIVDEEHDPGYKSDRTPRYQARDLALELGRLARAPVVLGSATPDVVSVGRARAGELTELRLDRRLAGSPAAVEVVDLRQELAEGQRGLLSRPLAAALGQLDPASGERAILVINRRGSASVVLCRDCGYVQICPECQRPLVYHATASVLRCHHCGASAPPARRCPACGSPRIRYLGGGTERVEREVRLSFPELRVGRLDRDVVERRGAAIRVIDDFSEGRLDVLVGTSLVAKGLDVPEVTLVGIVSADIALNLPDERAAERTFQLLSQAIGRAGRGERAGRAIVQTYQPDHRVIRAVASGDADAFWEAELAARRRFGSPPYGSLVKLTAAGEERTRTEEDARRMADRLRQRALELGSPTTVLGPAPAYIARRAGRWRFTVILRGPDPLAVLGGDPGPPWSVDVDPESLL